MTAPSSPSSSCPPLSPVPPPVPVETHPNRGAALKRVDSGRSISEPGLLAPEDAYKAYSPPGLRPLLEVEPDRVANLGRSPDSPQAAKAAAAALRPAVASLRAPPAIPTAARLEQDRKRRSASRKRRQPAGWKKLLWIRQPHPDNYTDTETFLDHLQRNPKLRPYDFWPLVADSMVIVQHVCSVVLFICCFAGIYQGRISPVSVVGLASVVTVFGWVLWDHWMGQEEEAGMTALAAAKPGGRKTSVEGPDEGSTTGSEASFNRGSMYGNGHILQKPAVQGLGLSLSASNLGTPKHQRNFSQTSRHSHSVSATSFQSISSINSLQDSSSEALVPVRSSTSRQQPAPSSTPLPPPSGSTLPTSLSPRIQSRLKTVKSTLLIYLTLLGLSPILMSLTRSTSSDSIWALATWLLIINIFFFDYGGLHASPARQPSRPQPPTALPSKRPHRNNKNNNNNNSSSSNNNSSSKLANTATSNESASTSSQHPISTNAPPFPSSLSTNAALMASTVLASRLPSITHVFSLTVFSIEVFGLFPVFRRHLRHTWPTGGHAGLTVLLVLSSSAGMSIVLASSHTHLHGACGLCWRWIWHVVRRSLAGVLVGSLGAAFAMGGCSWWLIGLQRYKNVVTGPWDPARPVLTGGLHLGRGRGSSG